MGDPPVAGYFVTTIDPPLFVLPVTTTSPWPSTKMASPWGFTPLHGSVSAQSTTPLLPSNLATKPPLPMSSWLSKATLVEYCPVTKRSPWDMATPKGYTAWPFDTIPNDFAQFKVPARAKLATNMSLPPTELRLSDTFSGCTACKCGS